MGFKVEDDLNTDQSRQLWREWKRRGDPEHGLDPHGDGRKPKPKHEKDSGEQAARGLAAGRSMVRDGLIREGSFWGTRLEDPRAHGRLPHSGRRAVRRQRSGRRRLDRTRRGQSP